MITKREAVARTIRKWEAYTKGEEPEDKECGLCTYMKKIPGRSFPIHREDPNELCQGCIVFPDICANRPEHLAPTPLYWQWHFHYSGGQRRVAEGIAKQILEAVMVRGEAWVEEKEIERNAASHPKGQSEGQ